jgi:hypothetical protein
MCEWLDVKWSSKNASRECKMRIPSEYARETIDKRCIRSRDPELQYSWAIIQSAYFNSATKRIIRMNPGPARNDLWRAESTKALRHERACIVIDDCGDSSLPEARMAIRMRTRKTSSEKWGHKSGFEQMYEPTTHLSELCRVDEAPRRQ